MHSVKDSVYYLEYNPAASGKSMTDSVPGNSQDSEAGCHDGIHVGQHHSRFAKIREVHDAK